MRGSLIAALVLTLCALGARPRAQGASPVFTAEDMLAIRTFAGGQPVAVSSTGDRIAYVLTDRDDEWNVQEPRPTGHIHVQTLTGGRPGPPRALTSGTAHSAFPVWSPDGRRLAFIREEHGRGHAVVWDAERDHTTAVGDPFASRIYLAPQWDPFGRMLIVAAALPDQAAQPYRVRSVKSTDVRIPGDQVFIDERRATLTAIDVASGVSTALTSTPIVLRSFQLSPTGRQALYVTPAPETLGIVGKEQNDTFVLTIAAAAARPGTAVKLAERGRFSWSPDGTQSRIRRSPTRRSSRSSPACTRLRSRSWICTS
jgi:dipeptidyl aminopeptidase/acylaminoacyl peptidase